MAWAAAFLKPGQEGTIALYESPRWNPKPGALSPSFSHFLWINNSLAGEVDSLEMPSFNSCMGKQADMESGRCVGGFFWKPVCFHCQAFTLDRFHSSETCWCDMEKVWNCVRGGGEKECRESVMMEESQSWWRIFSSGENKKRKVCRKVWINLRRTIVRFLRSFKWAGPWRQRRRRRDEHALRSGAIGNETCSGIVFKCVSCHVQNLCNFTPNLL